MKSVIIGIAGGTGSGKSTFTNRLKEAFCDNIAVLIMIIITKSKMEFPLRKEKR